MNHIKYCGTCVFRGRDGAHCGLTDKPIDPEKDYCSRHQKTATLCSICGNFIVGNNIILDEQDGAYYEICMNCFKSLGTCPTCGEARFCDFETNPIQIPKVVNQQVRQGNMIMTTQARNPQRIQETCAKNCKCWDGAQCSREYNNCNKYNHKY